MASSCTQHSTTTHLYIYTPLLHYFESKVGGIIATFMKQITEETDYVHPFSHVHKYCIAGNIGGR